MRPATVVLAVAFVALTTVGPRASGIPDALGPLTFGFRDRFNRSFVQYEGMWTIESDGGMAEIGYELTARPAFREPDFVLRRLFDVTRPR